jgi:hypothetical protein
LGGGGILIADAAPGDDDSTFVPITPCRLFDTRPAHNIGPKNTPLAAGESAAYTQPVTGTNGNCTIPADAVAISMNVTITDPTAMSNLRVYPADVAAPLVSNLNWLPGQSPTPNKVDVKLSADGKIKLFNWSGTVNVLADVVGYYTDASLKELQADIDALAATVANNATVMASASVEEVDESLDVGGPVIAATVTIVAPVSGTIQLVGNVAVGSAATIGTAGCWMTIGDGPEVVIDFSDRLVTAQADPAEDGIYESCATNAAIEVDAGTHVLNFHAEGEAGMGLFEASLDAIFAPGGTVTLTPIP